MEGGGLALMKQFQAQGLNMLFDHARFEDERQDSVEAGLMLMLDLFKTGRLKVFDDLTEWWDEFRMYHRRDGRVYKEADDLMSASRYAIVMRRFAEADRVVRHSSRGYVRSRVTPTSWMGS